MIKCHGPNCEVEFKPSKNKQKIYHHNNCKQAAFVAKNKELNLNSNTSEQFDEYELEILKRIKNANLSYDETDKVIKNLKQISPKKYKTQKIDFGDKEVQFGVFSDAHMGHQDYRPDVFRKMIKDGKREGIEFWLNCGDTIEGMSNREGHIYQLSHLGATAQFEYFMEEFSKFDKPVYSIEAQDSHGGWMHSKSNMGLDIGKELDGRSENYKFIGYDEQDLKLDNGLKIRMRHPGGGTAYALSYKAQKYIESIGGGDKPNILFQGHFHKAGYIFYRNIHSFDAGALQDQSPFMKKIGTPSHVGYWIIKAKQHKTGQKGVESITSRFSPFYD